MAKVAIVTATGVASATSGSLYRVNITKVATGTTPTVQVWDNPSAASGRKLFEGDGLSQQSFDMTDGNGGATVATQGLWVVTSAGTSAAEVVIVYD